MTYEVAAILEALNSSKYITNKAAYQAVNQMSDEQIAKVISACVENLEFDPENEDLEDFLMLFTSIEIRSQTLEDIESDRVRTWQLAGKRSNEGDVAFINDFRIIKGQQKASAYVLDLNETQTIWFIR